MGVSNIFLKWLAGPSRTYGGGVKAWVERGGKGEITEDKNNGRVTKGGMREKSIGNQCLGRACRLSGDTVKQR